MSSPLKMRHRIVAVLSAAVTAVSLLPAASFAQEFIDPDDPCLGDPPAAPFEDREAAIDVHLNNIDCAFDHGIIVGREENGDRFLRPAEPTRRDQMASIVVRALEAAGYVVPEDVPDAFTDDEDSVHELHINRLAALGVVAGKGNGRFAPRVTSSRLPPPRSPMKPLAAGMPERTPWAESRASSSPVSTRTGASQRASAFWRFFS